MRVGSPSAGDGIRVLVISCQTTVAATVPDIPLSEIPGYAEVAEIVAGRPLYHFSDVASFCYRRRDVDELGEAWPSIELVVEERVAPHGKIGFRFRGVREVEFSGWGSIVGLYFRSIRDRGWENARFEVGDYEFGGIHLYCYEISVFFQPEITTTEPSVRSAVRKLMGQAK